MAKLKPRIPGSFLFQRIMSLAHPDYPESAIEDLGVTVNYFSNVLTRGALEKFVTGPAATLHNT